MATILLVDIDRIADIAFIVRVAKLKSIDCGYSKRKKFKTNVFFVFVESSQSGATQRRKHRRGKKSKILPKKTKNQYPPWKMDVAASANVNSATASCSSGARTKLVRSRSLLVPYNTNRFLMEEHMSELPRDDFEDNCFGLQTEDQELFLSKEFSNVYERARVERLETMNKQELIQECLQIEDRYAKDQGRQRQQSLNAQNISKEFGAKVRALEEKIRDLTRENQSE